MSKALSRQSSLIPTIFDDFINPWNNLFSNSLRAFPNAPSVPAVNISTSNGDYNLTMAAPGLKKEDFKIDFEDSLLTISCEKEDEKEHTEERYTRKEYNYASFTRTFTLPTEVNVDKIEAHYLDGVLKIKMPIKEEFKHSNVQKHISIK